MSLDISLAIQKQIVDFQKCNWSNTIVLMISQPKIIEYVGLENVCLQFAEVYTQLENDSSSNWAAFRRHIYVCLFA